MSIVLEQLTKRYGGHPVATFLGSANLLVGQATPHGVQAGPLHFPLNTEASRLGQSPRVQVLFRTEAVALASAADALGCPRLGQGIVEQTTFAGSFERLRRRQRVLLDEVVEQALELTRPLIDQRDQNVVMELPYPLPPIVGDAPRLTQVFVYLLANANKFAPPGSIIQIGRTRDDDAITLWVEDQGPGLPELPNPSLFTRFLRSSTSEDEPEQSGAGLGLWTVKSIVERHGGRVDARRPRRPS